jgi:hypothetical protein
MVIIKLLKLILGFSTKANKNFLIKSKKKKKIFNLQKNYKAFNHQLQEVLQFAFLHRN